MRKFPCLQAIEIPQNAKMSREIVGLVGKPAAPRRPRRRQPPPTPAFASFAPFGQNPAMIPAARISAAIEILSDVETRRRPAADAMKDWGLAHRFAGSGDRAAVAGLLYDALRRKSSSVWLLGEATPRAEVLGALKQLRGLGVDEIAALFTGEGHAPPPLADVERERLSRADLAGAPAHVAGDYPEWLGGGFAGGFGAGGGGGGGGRGG